MRGWCKIRRKFSIDKITHPLFPWEVKKFPSALSPRVSSGVLLPPPPFGLPPSSLFFPSPFSFHPSNARSLPLASSSSGLDASFSHLPPFRLFSFQLSFVSSVPRLLRPPRSPHLPFTFLRRRFLLFLYSSFPFLSFSHRFLSRHFSFSFFLSSLPLPLSEF